MNEEAKEKYEEYLELYPLHKALCEDVVNNIGSFGQIDRTITSPEHDYNHYLSRVAVIYSTSKKELDKLMEGLREKFKIYNDVTFESYSQDSSVVGGVMGKLLKEHKIRVSIPTSSNKNAYLKLDIIKKQELRIEAAKNVKTSLVALQNQQNTGLVDDAKKSR